jgi:hypothetical protein
LAGEGFSLAANDNTPTVHGSWRVVGGSPVEEIPTANLRRMFRPNWCSRQPKVIHICDC